MSKNFNFFCVLDWQFIMRNLYFSWISTLSFRNVQGEIQGSKSVDDKERSEL